VAFEVGGANGRRVRPTMNVTPLVDVVLVLLIIFMVITPLLTKQFWVHVPKKEDPAKPEPPPPPDAPPPVLLLLAADGALHINKDVVTAAELPERLKRIFAARHDHTLFFDAEDGVHYGDAMAAMDLARGGGALTIAVLHEPAR
jgi:biopolymer transport protein ExbD